MNAHAPLGPPRQSNTLGTTSLVLGILGCVGVFSVALCAGLGQQQGWLKHLAGLLFVVGGTFAFVGVLSATLGFFGLFGRNRSRAAAVIGLILGAAAVLLFIATVQSTRG